MNKELSYFDTIALEYESLYNDTVSLAENEIIKRLIIEHTKYSKKLSILDLWCWTWLIVDLLWEKIEKYYWIDISEEMIRISHDKFPNSEKYTFLVEDINNSTILNNTNNEKFNLIVSTFGSASYIKNLPDQLEIIYSKLEPEWIAFLMVYSCYSLHNLITADFGLWSISLQSNHPYLFRNDTWKLTNPPDGCFYNTTQLSAIAKNSSFSNHHILGLNFFLDRFKEKSSLSKDDCVIILEEEMSKFTIPDLAHSLILILHK